MNGELLPLGATGMTFEPIPAGVDGVCRELAQELRTLAVRLGISMSRYARQVHRDRSTLSRWFSGLAVPPADFLDRLTSDVEAATGLPLTPEARDHLRHLHRSALAERNPRSAELQSLRDRWSDADQEARELRTEVDLLKDMLRTAQHKAAEQERTLHQLERGAATARLEHRAELALVTEDHDRLRAEHDRLLGLVERLHEELREAQRRQLEAEQRCDLLEHQLEAAELAAERTAADDPLQEQAGTVDRETERLRLLLAELEAERSAAAEELAVLKQRHQKPQDYRMTAEEIAELVELHRSSPGNDAALLQAARDQPADVVARLITRLRSRSWFDDRRGPVESAVQGVMAAVLSRTAEDIAQLSEELEACGQPTDSEQLLSSAAWGSPDSVVELAELLRASARHTQLAGLLASAGRRPTEEVVPLLTAFRAGIGDPRPLLDAVSVRPPEELATVLADLRDIGDERTVNYLLQRASTRHAAEVSDVIITLAARDQLPWARFLFEQTRSWHALDRAEIRRRLNGAGLGGW
ncbi:helix-turn-helix domain-containing protein [Kitasatospora sp. NPDC051853]|uniref:helix-turn-helix domain-containing protein n=1 Tax=Kitasatospora sp. NPDC051853 TaxID=3364058 RepID=UPI0037B43B0A